QPTDAGPYRVRVFNPAGSATSLVATLTVIIPPNITTQPASQVVNLGSPLALQIQASGTGPLSYQWSKNGADLSGATSGIYGMAFAGANDAGLYRVRVSNLAGVATS